MNLRDFDVWMHRIVEGGMIINHARHEDQTPHTYDKKIGPADKRYQRDIIQSTSSAHYQHGDLSEER